MSPKIFERSVEEAIECALLAHGPDACAGDSMAVREMPPPYGETPPGGYCRRKPEDYDRTLCLLPRDVLDFVLATQPREWKKLEQHHGTAVREQFLKRLAAEIERRGALDVLANYSTYKAYWRLLKRVESDPRYDKKKAGYLLKSFVELHPHAIGEKVRIMVEHFAAKVQGEIAGKAKAMIVTRSRLHAVRYKLATDKVLAERGYPFKALVAFSGTVQDGGQAYTESGMNGFPEAQTEKTFEQPEFRFLIVANKFQTGFDQPLLHTMYVDKKLGGVNACRRSRA